MFDFQKLTVYNKAKSLNIKVTELLKTLNPDRVTKDQLRRASFSIVLNIAKGSGRFTKPDKINTLPLHCRFRTHRPY